MEELRQTALAYYRDAPEYMRSAVYHFFQEKKQDAKDRVSRQDFLEYMKMNEDCSHMSNHSFFDVLKTEESEGLDFTDVLTLLYIRYSGRPFCNGKCKTFIKGSYFTCVKCYDNSTETFNVCATCYLYHKYIHQHEKFLDNYLLSEAKRREALSLKLKQEASSIMNGSKAHESVGAKDLKKKLQSSSGSSTAPEGSNRSTSNALVPVNPKPKHRSSAPEGSNRSTSNALVPVNPKAKHRSSAPEGSNRSTSNALVPVNPKAKHRSSAPEGSNRSTSNALVPVNPKPKHRSSAPEGSNRSTSNALVPVNPKPKHRSSAPEGSNRSTSNALVPVNPKPKHRSSAGKNAIKAVELALAFGNIFVTSAASQCVIL